MDENKVVQKCGNCAFYLKLECPRKFSADTHTYRGLIACETFKPMTDEEKRTFDPAVLRKPPSPRCPQCNRVLKEPWKACPYCGGNLTQTPSAPPPSSARYDLVENPSPLWYLAPLLFGLIGGIIGYLGTKDSDKDMAFNLLVFGIIWSFVLFVIGLLVLL